MEEIKTPEKKDNRKKLLVTVLLVIALALTAIAVYFWYNNEYFVSTEDATISGDMVNVSPQITGKLLDFYVQEGDTVTKDQVLGRQDVAYLTSDNNIDMSLIRAPITGRIIKKNCNIGEVESPSGQPLAIIIDPSKLYITANIEETKLSRLLPGQKVDITIDAIHGVKFSGKLRSVGQAANSIFSLIPTTSGGTFTKVVQRIPIKVDIDKNDFKLLPGTNAVIKIHVK